MAQSMATKVKSNTLVGTSIENAVAVIKLPDPKKVFSLMTMVNAIIEKHGRLSAMRTITSRHWLYLDVNTTADDDPMAVPGFGVAVADDDPRIAKKARRLITVSREWIERYTLVKVNGKEVWQQRGENAHLETAKVETKADADRLAKQKAKKAGKAAGAAKKPAAPKAKGTKKSTAPKATKSAGAPKQKTVKKDGVFSTVEQKQAVKRCEDLEFYARNTGNVKDANAFKSIAPIAKENPARANRLLDVMIAA